MASYIRQNLMDGEEVVDTASIHWFVYVPGAILTGAGLWASAFFEQTIGMLMFVMGVFLLVRALIIRRTTEIAVTSRRVMIKKGLIRRITMEMNHGRIESYNVDQSILGRIFGYGTLVVNGTGTGHEVIEMIDNPLEFRRKALEVADRKPA